VESREAEPDVAKPHSKRDKFHDAATKVSIVYRLTGKSLARDNSTLGSMYFDAAIQPPVDEIAIFGKQFFEEFSDAHAQILAVSSTKVTAKHGDILFGQGQVPDNIYGVIHGRVNIHRTSGSFVPGTPGEKAVAAGELVGDQKHTDPDGLRSCTAEVGSDTAELVCIPKGALDELMRRRLRIQRREIRQTLCNVPIFRSLASLPRGDSKRLLSHVDKIHRKAGEAVYREQDDVSGMFLVVGGQVELLQTLNLVKNFADRARPPLRASRVMQISNVGPGEYFGETDMLASCPRCEHVYYYYYCYYYYYYYIIFNYLRDLRREVGGGGGRQQRLLLRLG